MFFRLFIATALFFSIESVAQQRQDFQPELAPFYHGVASGDPTANSVIIWTRITSANPTETVTWKMATDTGLTNIIASGTETTNATQDYTIKVEVTGLNPATYYYYQFRNGDRVSLTGRTKTFPVGANANHVRFAVVACSNYPSGYFNAYWQIANRNDLDAVLHLGDYIYEYASSSGNRPVEPDKEITLLEDYRGRYSHYRLDPDLRAVHQQYPFITVWDDHESADNSWVDGANNHTPGTEGDWETRKNNAAQAYSEWLPLRYQEPGNNLKIFRKIEIGDLANLYMLDTRLFGRTEQNVGAVSDRTILGEEQRTWLLNELLNSTAKWNVLGQQVVMSKIPFVGEFNTDSWYGYTKDRDTIYNTVLNNNLSDLIVLTGDVHTAWASDLVAANYDPNTQAGSAGVEFVCNSVTSGGSPIPLTLQGIQSAGYKNVKYVEASLKGYIVVDLKDSIAQCDFYEVPTIAQQSDVQSFDGGFFTEKGTRYLQTASGEATPLQNVQPLAPVTVNHPVSVGEVSPNVIIGVYPNPFIDKFIIQYHADYSGNASVKLIDSAGKTIWKRNENLQRGINYLELQAGHLPVDNYILMIQQGSKLMTRPVVKE